jgi:hypothetical protein
MVAALLMSLLTNLMPSATYNNSSARYFGVEINVYLQQYAAIQRQADDDSHFDEAFLRQSPWR